MICCLNVMDCININKMVDFNAVIIYNQLKGKIIN